MTTFNTIPDLDNKTEWQTFVMAKNYELANDPDPDTRGKALERLAKSCIVGLYETKISVNVSLLPPEALQDKLESLVNTKVSEFVFSRIAVVHSWFPGLLALTS